MTRLLLPLLLLLAGAGAALAGAGHDEALRLRESGEIRPLTEILDRLGDGQVIEVELERHRGRLIYEAEVLDEHGRVRKHFFDAHTGEPIRPRERRRQRND